MYGKQWPKAFEKSPKGYEFTCFWDPAAKQLREAQKAIEVVMTMVASAQKSLELYGCFLQPEDPSCGCPCN